MKSISLRMDIVSRTSFEKKDLIRIVKTPSGLLIDIDQDKKGRGFYIKKDKETILKARKKDILRKYNSNDNSSIYDQLEALC